MLIEPDLRARIEAEMARFPEPRGALLGALHAVQESFGAVTPELASELAEIFDLRPVEVLEVVSFYSMLSTAPRGRHQVRVCTNLSCSLAGARDFLRGLEQHLGVEAGETTADGRITLAPEECLGACANAPMMRIDDVYHEDLDLEHATRVLDALE